MDKIYSEKFKIRTSDFDTHGNIKPSAVLDLFQEVAGTHAKLLGIGFSDLSKKGLLWVLVKVKYKQLEKISMHQSVVVKTWPLKPSRVTMQREYVIEDLDGNVLCIGTSDWVLMNAETRRFAPTENLYPLKEFCVDRNFEDKMRKIPDFSELDALSCEISPSFCDIDMNGHVNNIRYADFVINLLNPQQELKIDTFQIDFHREIKGDMSVLVSAQIGDSEIVSKGTDKSGERMFCCKITINK